MISKSVALAFLVVACYAVLQSEAQHFLIPNEDEKQICQDNAKGREVTNVNKRFRRTCYVECTYDDGNTESYNSPKGQLCCDMVGIGPTGCCSDGKCSMMNCGNGNFFG